MMDGHPHPEPAESEAGWPTSSSLGLLDAEHMAVFRNALDKILLSDIAETTYSEILDGLPTKDSWLEFDVWQEGHPVNVLGHKELCAGTREKARRLRAEFDFYILSFPTAALRDFQRSLPGTRSYLLDLIELLARSCHEIAVRLFELDDGVHKHSVYEAWRDAPVDPLSNPMTRPFRRPSVFCHGSYSFHDQYPHGLADVVGYWAEAKIFGGVVVFDRGPSGTERKEIYLHGGHKKAPLTLFPPTSEQFDSLAQYLLQGQSAATPCPLPIHASCLNGYRYHPDDAMSRFNIFRDRYERKEPPTRSTHHIYMDGRNWPEMGYLFHVLDLHSKRAQGEQVDEAELAAAEEGRRRITPSSPWWPYGGEIDPEVTCTDDEWMFR
ncbi:hypothetical protein FJTKL_06951 [Diaporthe vaccinii]|uniref:Uncharacterized protein n=1 Tax=Diaporthe vaccinii TaxID=105482 RepID=A0ABR4DSZ3_9PEZI